MSFWYKSGTFYFSFYYKIRKSKIEIWLMMKKHACPPVKADGLYF